MSGLEDITSIRNKLWESLGEKKETYMVKMKLWFRMKMSKSEFDREVRAMLSDEQVSLHNSLMSQLFNKCVQSSRNLTNSTVLPTSNKHKQKPTTGSNKRRNRQSNGFQIADIHDYVSVCRVSIPLDEPPRYCTQEFLIPDQEFIYLRLMLAAWEGGLKGAENSAADLLVAAIQHFLKDVITAIISRKKGYQLKHGKFMYGLGTPVPNPWLRNTVKLLMNDENERSVLELSESDKNLLVPAARPTSVQLQQEIALRHACSNIESSNSRPLSPSLCLEAFQVNRSVIFSNSVYAVNMERILAQIHHPSWEDMGES